MSTQVCGVSGRRYEDRAVVVLPTQIIHPIDQDSPFYCLHPSELASMDLELERSCVGDVLSVLTGRRRA